MSTVTGPVETCTECAALFEDRDFDCVLLEPELSDGTSFAFARHLHDSEQPFAFLTARTDIVQEAGFPHAAAFAMEEGATSLAQWLEGRE